MRYALLILCTILLAPLFFVQAVSAAPLHLSDQDIEARLHYATQALDSQKTGADYWEYGWGAFNGGTMIWSAIQAATDRNRKDRNADIVNATESLIGLADIVLRPLPAFDADNICDAAENRLSCVADKEKLLQRSAERARDPYEALPHLENAAFNLAAGLIVWQLGGKSRALSTAIPGEIIGELQLWTIPSQPIADFNHYRMTFSPLLIETAYSRQPFTGVMLSFRF